MPTVHLTIKGKVQGVFYRATAKETADKLGLVGWVKNTKEGNVEGLVSGSPEQVQSFIDWCKKGPARAEVSDVIVTEVEEQVFKGFKVIR